MRNEDLVLDLVESALGLKLEKWTPDWLLRPGRSECGDLWPLVCQAYAELTGQGLPEEMPPTEKRNLDAYVPLPINAFLEFDEKQHFNAFRLKTYEFYPPDFRPGYPIDGWKEACKQKVRLETGGFAKPKPPLFPGPGGRHRQRAFRDMLTDLLPPTNGYAPTIRIADFEVSSWLRDPEAVKHMRLVLKSRVVTARWN